jgi:hypothetical protein
MYTGYIIYDFPNVWNLPNLAELILRKWRRTRFPEHAVNIGHQNIKYNYSWLDLRLGNSVVRASCIYLGAVGGLGFKSYGGHFSCAYCSKGYITHDFLEFAGFTAWSSLGSWGLDL